MQDPRKDSEGTYSTREVADLFGVNVDTVRRWHQNGLLDREEWPTNGYRYSVELVEKLLNDPGGDGS